MTLKEFLDWLNLDESDNGFGFFMFCLFVGLPAMFMVGYFLLRLVELTVVGK